MNARNEEAAGADGTSSELLDVVVIGGGQAGQPWRGTWPDTTCGS